LGFWALWRALLLPSHEMPFILQNFARSRAFSVFGVKLYTKTQNALKTQNLSDLGHI
jgi:hypothetical protein